MVVHSIVLDFIFMNNVGHILDKRARVQFENCADFGQEIISNSGCFTQFIKSMCTK